MAPGQVGAAGGGVGAVGGGVGEDVDVGGTLATAGVVVNVRPAVTSFALAAVADVVCGADEADEPALVVVADFAATSAGAVFAPSKADSALSVLGLVDEFATISAVTRDKIEETDGPAPWIRITAATTAVARTTAFFNVCTPIQRLHCPPN